MSPMDPKDYPPDWPAISREIRARRANGQCECTGECGRHHGTRCAAINHATGHRDRTGQWYPYKVGRDPEQWSKPVLVVLTVAHLWRGPCAAHHAAGIKCGDADHLKAMCQGCHLRYDLAHHVARRKRNRFEKKAIGDLFA